MRHRREPRDGRWRSPPSSPWRFRFLPASCLRIDDESWVAFVPVVEGDQTLSVDAFDADGSWLFMAKAHGYIGFWSSLPTEPWTGVNADCERRIYGDDIACLCVCGGREHASPAAFRAHCRALAPDYTGGVLRAGRLSMSWPS